MLRAYNFTNLCNQHNKIYLQNVPSERRSEFAQSLQGWFVGETADANSVIVFAHTLQELTGQKPAWPVVTYLPFLLFPQEHIFIKPRSSRDAAQILQFDVRYKATPNIETYTRFQTMADLLMGTLENLHPQDWIDIQSFLWVIAHYTQHTDDPISEPQLERQIDNHTTSTTTYVNDSPLPIISKFDDYLTAHSFYFLYELLT